MEPSSSPVIFLDVGGVLVHEGTIHNRIPGEPWHSVFAYAATVDLDCVRRVLRIVEATGAQIVVSSDWRRNNAQSSALKRAFIDAGMDRRAYRDLVIGSTPHLDGKTRAHEVAAWLANHPAVTHYLVLDDQVVEGHQQLSDRPSSFTGGLQEAHVEEAIRLLGVSG